MTDEELETELTAIGSPIPPTFFSSLDSYRELLGLAATNDIAALGGTPKTHRAAYEAVSPVCHADISIPVITIHVTANSLILYYHSLLYQTAVAKLFHSEMYRLYLISVGGYSTSNVTDEMPSRFNELVEWSNELTGSVDWPMYRQNVQHTGCSTSNAPNTNQSLWTFPAGSALQCSPSVADGKVYVGSFDCNMYCLDAATGTLIWSYTAGGNVGISSPAVADGKVYFGSYDGKLYCLNVETGAFIWSYQTGSSAMFNSGPAVANGVVYVACSDRMVYAFSAWAPIPEGLTLGVMLLLSTVAVIVSMRYYRKRPKWKNW